MGITVLVVDDESVTRRIVTHTLKTLDIDVIGAENAQQALDYAQETPPSLALVDVNLPDMDGFTLVGKLKALPDMADVPLIIFTARNHPQDSETAAQLGAAGFFYKPFSTGDLRSLVTNHLDLD